MLNFSENVYEYALVIVAHEDQIKIHKMLTELKIENFLYLRNFSMNFLAKNWSIFLLKLA